MAQELAKIEERFETRWKNAYEFRLLENQNRHKEPAEALKVHHLSSSMTHPGCTQHASHQLPSTTIRQQEVDDDEDDSIAVVPSPAVTEEDTSCAEADGGLEYRVAWDSSHSQHSANTIGPDPGMSASSDASAKLKEQGTACLARGDLQGALAHYSEAIGIGQPADGSPQLLATLHSNRSHVFYRLKRWQEAAADAQEAHRLLPSWPKPLHRLAQAQLAQGLFAAAVGACLQGEALCKKDSEGHTLLTPLLDQIAVAAAREGSLVGFTGALLEKDEESGSGLQVRDAGEEAWLGRPAPHVPELDGPQDDDSVTTVTTIPALPSTAAQGTAGALAALTLGRGGGRGGAAGDALATWDYRQTAAARERRRTSFRSLKEAVAAARDGDKIVLRRGTHNGMGEAVNVSKRLLIYGEGQLGETVIDQRANSPTFRVTRGGVVIRNLDIDMSGFCEAVMVTGGDLVQPLLEDLVIKCSGDDAINVCGQADPMFRRCTISGKKCGARVYDNGRGTFEECMFEKCGEQAVKAMETAAPTLRRCTLVECLEEGVVVMECSRVGLFGCDIRGCKGPGVDCSGRGQVAMEGGSIQGNVGGVWVWEGGRAELRGVEVEGGRSHALLADGGGRLSVKSTTIHGSVHATEEAWEEIVDDSNTMRDPDRPTDFPPEEGPFKFVPNRITRKQ